MYQHRIAGDLSVSDHIMSHGFAFGNHQHIDAAARQYVVDNIHAFIGSKIGVSV